MKIVLDTTNKTIKIEELVILGELVETLERILPMGLWKEFKLETNTQIVWSAPIIIRDYTNPYRYPNIDPHYPWYNPVPWITYTESGLTASYQLQTGTYCIEV